MYLEFIRYCRDKGSSFGHSARKKDIELAWELTKGFLDEYTEYDLAIQPQIELWRSSPEVMDDLLERITNKYGVADIESGTPYRWILPKKMDQELLELAFLNKKYQKHRVGPIRVSLPFHFTWKDISNSVHTKYTDVYEYFNKGKHGWFSVTVDSRLFIQPNFIIPFSFGTKEASEFIDTLRSNLPFKLSESSLVCFREKTLKSGKVTYKTYGTYKSLT
jgi:hypothetical protein